MDEHTDGVNVNMYVYTLEMFDAGCMQRKMKGERNLQIRYFSIRMSKEENCFLSPYHHHTDSKRAGGRKRERQKADNARLIIISSVAFVCACYDMI